MKATVMRGGCRSDLIDKHVLVLGLVPMFALVDRRSLALALLAPMLLILVAVNKNPPGILMAALVAVDKNPPGILMAALVAVDKNPPGILMAALVAVDKNPPGILTAALVVVDKNSILRIVFCVVQFVKMLSLRKEMLNAKFPGGKGKKVNKF